MNNTSMSPSSPPPRLVRENSAEDLEELIQATKLCEPCRTMLGPAENRTLVEEESETNKVHHEHHASYEALVQCTHTGCRICVMLLRDMGRYSKRTSTTLDPDGRLVYDEPYFYIHLQ